MTRNTLITCALAAFVATPLAADPARIVGAEARPDGQGWRFDVTLEHGDTGWDDYADGWRVLGPEGAVLGERTLFHPHVNEQPFTRSLGGVTIPEGLSSVEIEASTNVTGWGGDRLTVALP